MVTTALIACSVILFAVSYCGAFYQNAVPYVRHNQRIQNIEEQKVAGIKDVVVDYILRVGTRTAWADVTQDPENWTNPATAKYYGLESIRIQ